MTDDGHSSIPDAGDMQVTTPDGMSNGTPRTISSGNTTPLLQQAPATPEHAALAAQHKQQARSHKHDKHRRMTNHNRPWTTLITTWRETTFTGGELPPERWDGNPEHKVGPPSSWFRALAATVKKDIETSDSSDDGNQEPTVAKMTRKERKALDREIPWRTITTIDVKANRKEYESWRSWGHHHAPG